MQEESCNETVNLPLPESINFSAIVKQLSVCDSLSNLNANEVCNISVVSGPPSAGSNSWSGNWNAFMASCFTSKITASFEPGDTPMEPSLNGGPKYSAVLVTSSSPLLRKLLCH